MDQVSYPDTLKSDHLNSVKRLSVCVEYELVKKLLELICDPTFMTTYLFIFSCSHNMPSTTFGFVVQTHTRKHLLLFCIFYLGFSFKFIGLSDSNVGRINPGKPFKYTSCVWRLVWSDQNQINLTSTLHLLLKREPKGRGFTRAAVHQMCFQLVLCLQPLI